MADEISITTNFSVIKNFLQDQRPLSGTFDLVSAAPPKAAGIASIGTAAHEALAMGDVSTAGWALFQNLDATNYVQVGTDVAAAFVPFLKLKAGEFAVCRLGTNAPYAKANTAAVLLSFEIYED